MNDTNSAIIILIITFLVIFQPINTAWQEWKEVVITRKCNKLVMMGDFYRGKVVFFNFANG
jgi:hypothetical protein